MNPLIRDVSERNSQLSVRPVETAFVDKNTGFPIVRRRPTDRSSAFKRARGQQTSQVTSSASTSCKVAESTSSTSEVPESSSSQLSSSRDDTQISADALLANMTHEERVKEREEILEYFGPEVLGTIKKIKEAREKRKANLQASIPG